MLTNGATDHEQRIITDHFNYLLDLHEKGIVWMAGRTLTEDADSFGIVIFYANDDDAAESLMRNDPAVMNRVMQAKLFPFRIGIPQTE